MDVLEAIHSRCSIKAFRSDPVGRDLVETLLDAAVRAPNHRLTEPWSFYVLSGKAKQRFAELRRAVRARKFADPSAPDVQPSLQAAYEGVINTPVIIAVGTLVSEDVVQREEDYAATCCAMQNIMLAATSLGLGTYLRTGDLLDDPGLRELLDMPANRRVVGTIYLGYPADKGKIRKRTPAAEKTRWLD